MSKQFKKYFFLLYILTTACVDLLFAQQPVDTTYHNLSANDTLIADIIKKDTIVDVSKDNELEVPVDFNSADSIKFRVGDKKIYMYGEGDVVYGDLHLKSEFIELDMNKREVYAKGVEDTLGNVVGRPNFEQGSDMFDADSMRYNFKSKKGLTYGIVTQQSDGYLHSKKTKMTEDKDIHIKGGKYTTCDHENPHYFIAMTKAKVIPENQIVTGPAYLVVEDVPVPLAIPFGFFPISKGRTAGILMPTMGDDNRLGYFFKRGGFYFGFADYIDFKLTGDFYTLGSWRSRLESGYKNRYKYGGNFSLEYASLVEDEEKQPSSFSVIWAHSQDQASNPNNQFSANVNFQTMGHDRKNAQTQNEYLTNDISSSIYFRRKLGSLFSSSISVNHNQNNRDSIVNVTLPQFKLTMNSISPFSSSQKKLPSLIKNIRIGYGFDAKNKVKTKMDSTFFTETTINKFLYGGQHLPSLSTSTKLFKFFTLTPSVNYKERWYFNEFNREWDPNKMVIADGDTTYGGVRIDTLQGFQRVFDYSLGLSLSTKLYGMYTFRSRYLKAMRHVLTPSVGYTYSPDFGKEKWGYYSTVQSDNEGNTQEYSRFANMMYGTPSSGEVRSVNFSLGNNLEMKVRNKKDTVTGMKKVKLIENLSLSGNYNFALDSLNWSLMSLSARTTLFKRLSISYRATFDPYAATWEENKKREMRTNDLMIDKYGRIWRIKSDVWSVSPSLRLGPIANKNKLPRTYKGYYTYDVPWSLNLSYSLSLSRTFLYDNNNEVVDKEPDITQTLRVNGNFKLTPNLSTNFSTGWDFEANEITYTSFSINRSLHCWEMLFTWVPMGRMKSIEFTVRVKSSVLKDLKIDKSERYGDVYN